MNINFNSYRNKRITVPKSGQLFESLPRSLPNHILVYKILKIEHISLQSVFTPRSMGKYSVLFMHKRVQKLWNDGHFTLSMNAILVTMQKRWKGINMVANNSVC